jgi:Uma2 family endonuclease
MNTLPARLKASAGKPAWDLADLFPAQGAWDEWDYLALSGNRLVEFTDGYVEVLPVPTTSHQKILAFLFTALSAFVTPRRLGTALFSGIRVRLRKGKYREPDIVFMSAEHEDRVREKFWEGADLVMEVVSAGADDRERDLEEKPADYARARIPEYWIIDPHERQITVLHLKGRRYAVLGKYGPGERAASALIKGFAVDVEAVFAAARTNDKSRRRSGTL